MTDLEVLHGRPWAVLPGDCRETLATLPADSIDACVTDTPYGLSTILDPPNLDREALWRRLTEGTAESPIKMLMRAWLDTGDNPVVKGRGFMGKEWDALVPSPNTWRAIWRVLKPGAYCFAFGGTRTYDLISMSLRFADFEVDDMVTWLYGCLSEDTEIMVDGEWRHWTAAVAGSTVMAYSLEDDTLRPEVVQDLLVYDYDDVAFHVRGDRTDHIVSRNHRCLVRDAAGHWGFTVAEKAQRTSTIPVVEDDGGLRSVWQNSRTVQMSPEAHDHGVVLAGVQRGSARCRVGEARAQGASGLDSGGGAECCREDDGAKEPVMAGRCDLQELEGELYRGALRPSTDRVQVDGEARRVHPGAPPRGGASDRPTAHPHGGGAPHQPRFDGQPPGEPDVVRLQPGSQALRGARIATADMATVTPIHYRGKVWCVRVPSGAFVARRNGQVFITGNSGMPKRVRLDLKIDQHFGKASERPVVGISGNHGGGIKGPAYDGGLRRVEANTPVTGAATPEAARFVGWDRALRPGWEPIIVATKPRRGTIAENAMAHGTGGLHVDACRLPRGDAGQVLPNTRGRSKRRSTYDVGGEEDPIAIDPRGGYPANVALCEAVAEELDRMSGLRKSGARAEGDYNPGNRVYGGSIGQGHLPRLEASEGGASRFFYVAKASSSERDAGLEDLPPLTAGERCDREDGTAGVNGYAGTRGEGGRNIHPTLKPIALMRWLCRLAAPPGANDPDIAKRPVILDPFFGSGSTGVAALQEGLRVVGCEMVPEYVEIAKRRCQHAYALPPDDEAAPVRNADTAGQKSLF